MLRIAQPALLASVTGWNGSNNARTGGSALGKIMSSVRSLLPYFFCRILTWRYAYSNGSTGAMDGSSSSHASGGE